MSECRDVKDPKLHHRERSSESLMDKDEILAGLSITPGQIILDAGCGNGYMAKAFAELTGETGKVYALDPDPVVIDILKTETQGTIIEPFVGDITEETKLERFSIDLIYLSTVVHGFSRSQMLGFVKEVKRLLRPEGRLAIVEINKEVTTIGPPLEKKISPEELKEIVSMTPTGLIKAGQYFYMQIFNK